LNTDLVEQASTAKKQDESLVNRFGGFPQKIAEALLIHVNPPN